MTDIRVTGYSPDGARRVFADAPELLDARLDCLETAREYVEHRPDTGPLCDWEFRWSHGQSTGTIAA